MFEPDRLLIADNFVCWYFQPYIFFFDVYFFFETQDWMIRLIQVLFWSCIFILILHISKLKSDQKCLRTALTWCVSASELLILLMHDICLSIWIECFGVYLWIGIIKLIVASAFRARLTKSAEVLSAYHQVSTPTRISGKHTWCEALFFITLIWCWFGLIFEQSLFLEIRVRKTADFFKSEDLMCCCWWKLEIFLLQKTVLINFR